MHFSGGGGGGHGGGGGMGHSGAGHHGGHAGGHAGGHHGGGGEGGLSIGQILGLTHGHAGGFFGHLAHMLGGHHGAVHHNHHAGGEPDQSPSWNMAMQAEKGGMGGFLRKFKLRFTPAVGFFFLFIGLTFWLGVIYQLRHHEPTENFSALSKQLYGQQLPTTRLGGQTLPTVGISDPANENPVSQPGEAPMAAAAAATPQSFAGAPAPALPQRFAAAPATMQQAQFRGYGYNAAPMNPQVAYGRFGGPAPTYATPAQTSAPAYAVYGGQPGTTMPATAFGAYHPVRPGYAPAPQRWRVFVSH